MRWVFLITGIACVTLGFAGAFLPLLPTTPFLILAAVCFSRSSERLHRWLFNHRVLGTFIRDWEQFKVIPRRAKWIATIMISASCVSLWLSKQVSSHLSFIICAGMGLILLYIWRFPSAPPVGIARQQNKHPAKDTGSHRNNIS